ncbi:MAG: hypothetical protein GY849_06530, partial [Deltaproteobacteria bacterium]|nr:hypothetical protein [Deltaproteobacteria bacterium]
VGAHTITAGVTDSDGSPGAAAISLTVTEHVNVAPAVAISAPEDNASVSEDDAPFTLTATASDPEDGDLSADIQWTSSLDGAIASPTTLSAGAHTITASATDSDGLEGTAAISLTVTEHVNVAPSVAISAPANNVYVYENESPFTLTASASDPEDGDVGAMIQWTSSRDGAVASPAALSKGVHTITASATDAGGLTGEDAVTITVCSIEGVTVTLTWNPVLDDPTLEGYKLYYKIGSSGEPYDGTGADQGASAVEIPLHRIADLNAPEFTLTGLAKDVNFYFATTAYNNTGDESDYSNEAFHEGEPVNEAPSVAILEPADSASVSEDDAPFTLSGSASDPEDGDLGATIQWTSDLDGPLASPTPLSVGTHTITANVTDSEGLPGSATITVTVTEHVNVAPIVAITSPTDNAAVSEDNRPFTLTASASDLEDGDIGANIQWTSSIDGAVASPAPLSVGVHTITAGVTDSGGLPGSDAVTLTVNAHVNVAPTVAISTPANNASVSEDDAPFTLTASASDPEDGDITAAIQWTSSLDGPVVSPAPLSVGTHTITANAVDSGGLPGVAAITLTVTEHVNVAPTVVIAAPINNASVSEDDAPFALTATASDPEDGDLSAAIQWTSSLDGSIASPAALSVGAHTITAGVTDSDGSPGAAAISLTVTEHVNVAPAVAISAPEDNA